MKSKINFLLAALTLIILLQSCLKDHGPIIRPTDDKLLLSKVTGSNTHIIWNRFEFTGFTGDTSRYAALYSYSNDRIGFEDLRPIQEVSFPSNGGNWTFSYNDHLPYKVTDNSKPAVDQGYWEFYFNGKGQLIKTGLAFSTAAEPTEFEFYRYDDHNNLTDLVYGFAVDTPLYKQTYTYDARGNLTQWQLLFPNGYKNADATTGRQVFSSLANSPQTEKLIGKKYAEIMRRVTSQTIDNSVSMNSATGHSSSPLIGDSNVIYQNYITGDITTDGKINPYHQQDDIIFYVTSRNYSADISTNYQQLTKSNITSVSNAINPDFGSFAPMVSNYSYTYNNLGYPVTGHEATTDQGGIWLGPNFSYTQDRKYEYIKNW